MNNNLKILEERTVLLFRAPNFLFSRQKACLNTRTYGSLTEIQCLHRFPLLRNFPHSALASRIHPFRIDLGLQALMFQKFQYRTFWKFLKRAKPPEKKEETKEASTSPSTQVESSSSSTATIGTDSSTLQDQIIRRTEEESPTFEKELEADAQNLINQNLIEILKIPNISLQRIELSVTSFDGNSEQKGTVVLSPYVFSTLIRTDILHRVVVWQLAKRRQGTHKAKTRKEVRGGGRKPWKQKGTGRARQGTIRAPQWKGGGVVFPPTPRSHAFDLPKKIIKLGLRIALSAKLAQGKLEIVEESKLSSHKTKTFWEMAERRGWLKGTGTLIVTDSPQDRNLRLAASNIEKIDLISELGLNVYSILSRDKLVITRNALEALQARLVEDLDEKPIRVQLDVSL